MSYLFIIIWKHQYKILFYSKIFHIPDIHCIYRWSYYFLSYFDHKKKDGFRAKAGDILLVFDTCRYNGNTFHNHLCFDVFLPAFCHTGKIPRDCQICGGYHIFQVVLRFCMFNVSRLEDILKSGEEYCPWYFTLIFSLLFQSGFVEPVECLIIQYSTSEGVLLRKNNKHQ